MAVLSKKPKRTIYYGWWVLLACAALQFYLGGTFVQGFSALFNPLADEFGWTYALVSLAFTFRGFEAGVMSPVVGILVDKFGPRRLLFLGIIIMALSYWLFSRVDSLWSFYSYFMLLALGFSLASDVVLMTVVARWFQLRPSLAMGILKSGFAAGGLLMPVIVQLVDNFGWREAVIFFAIGTAILGIPLALLVKDPPEKGPATPKGGPSSGAKPKSEGMTPREVLRTKNFWLLSMAILFAQVAVQAVNVHQISYLASVGIERQTASFLIIILSISNVAGRLLFGWLGDVMEKRRCFVIGTVIKASAVFLFAMAGTTGQFVPTMIALGLGFGALIPLRPALQFEFFGTKSFATIQGMLMIFITAGSIVAPLFAGWVFDLLHNYRPAFLIFAGLTLIAVPLVLAMRKEPRPGATTS